MLRNDCANFLYFLFELENVGGDILERGDAGGTSVKGDFAEVNGVLDFDRGQIDDLEISQKQLVNRLPRLFCQGRVVRQVTEETGRIHRTQFYVVRRQLVRI